MGPRAGGITGAEAASSRAGPSGGFRESLGAEGSMIRLNQKRIPRQESLGPPSHPCRDGRADAQVSREAAGTNVEGLGAKGGANRSLTGSCPLGPGWERGVPLEHLGNLASNRRRRRRSLLPVSAWVPSLQGPVGQPCSGTEAGRRRVAPQAERTQAAAAASMGGRGTGDGKLSHLNPESTWALLSTPRDSLQAERGQSRPGPAQRTCLASNR